MVFLLSESTVVLSMHRRTKWYGQSGLGRTTFCPMTSPTITSTLCACSEFINCGHRVTSEPYCRCFVGEMDCMILPHQLPASFTFPKRSFGRRHLFFAVFSMLNWFKQWTFLHYDEAKDLVYCYTCLLCFKENRLRSANAEPAFL